MQGLIIAMLETLAIVFFIVIFMFLIKAVSGAFWSIIGFVVFAYLLVGIMIILNDLERDGD
jgi:hypothetical protein